jgi:Transmembrane protein 43
VAAVTYKSWGDRLRESIVGALIGIVLFIAAFPLLFWNEGRAVEREFAIKGGKADVVEADAKSVDPAKDGKEIHLTGEATTSETLTDPIFGVALNALRLSRKAEMYAWREEKKTETRKKLGGGEEQVTTYSYKTEWTEQPQESSNFDEPQGHENPTMPFKSEQWQAKQVKLDAYDLPADLAKDIGGAERLPVQTEMLAKASSDAKNMKVSPDGLLSKGNLSSPQVGDLRVEFTVIKPPKTVSVLTKQVGNSFGPYRPAKATSDIYRLMDGQKSADEMFAQLEAENTAMTWILRLVGFLCMAIGLFLVFRPFSTLGDVVPFIGDLLGLGLALFAGVTALALSLLTIAIGWVFYRPLLGISLLVVAGLLIGGLFFLGSKRRASRADLDKPRRA